MNKGVYTSEELIDTIIVDCNDAVKSLASGQYLQWCNLMATVANKLYNLKKGVADDLAQKNNTIEDLKEQLRLCGCDLQDVTPEEFVEDVQKGRVVCDR